MSPEIRRTSEALEGLAATLEEVCQDLHALSARARDLRGHVVGTQPLSQVMSAEPRPLMITTLTELVDRLVDASAEVRRAEAHALRAEGLSQERIADLFGVTRQRAAALLKPPPGPQARLARRPRR